MCWIPSRWRLLRKSAKTLGGLGGGEIHSYGSWAWRWCPTSYTSESGLSLYCVSSRRATGCIRNCGNPSFSQYAETRAASQTTSPKWETAGPTEAEAHDLRCE